MDVQTQLEYDAGVDEVFAMLCDREYRTRVCEATGAVSYDVAIDTGGDRVSVRISRMMPAPDIARRFVGETMEIVQREEWGAPAADGSRSAALTLEIPGKPASMNGSVTLTPAGSGTVETVSGDIKVRIPVVGGKLEKEIARGVTAGVKTEGKVGRSWLATT